MRAQFCSACGAPLGAGHKFCPRCGTPVSGTVPQARRPWVIPGVVMVIIGVVAVGLLWAVSRLGGPMAGSQGSSAVVIQGRYAYVAGVQAGLVVVDVTDPAHPRQVGGYDTPGAAYGVAVGGDYA